MSLPFLIACVFGFIGLVWIAEKAGIVVAGAVLLVVAALI